MTGNIVIVSVIPGGPADDAGIRAGDRVVEVNGEPVAGLAPEDVAGNVRGDEGSTVEVILERPSTGERLELSMVRERLRVPAATGYSCPARTSACCGWSSSRAGSADDLRAARDAAVAAGATALILDLRGNPGGYVDRP